MILFIAQNHSPRRLPPLIEVPLKTTVHQDCRLGTSTKWGCEIYRALPYGRPPRPRRSAAVSAVAAFGTAPRLGRITGS